jgi:hypothetical protein
MGSSTLQTHQNQSCLGSAFEAAAFPTQECTGALCRSQEGPGAPQLVGDAETIAWASAPLLLGAGGELNLGLLRQPLFEPPVMLSAQRRFAVGQATIQVDLTNPNPNPYPRSPSRETAQQ